MSRTDSRYQDARPYAFAVAITQGLFMAAIVANLGIVFALLNGAVTVASYAGASDVVLMGCYLVAAVAFAVWTWRVVANARTFKPSMNASPGWAIGWYFVPIASLWKPFGYMQETWDASSAQMSRHGSALLRWWWGLWIASTILSSIGTQLAAAEQGRGLGLGMIMVITALTARLVLAVLVIRMAFNLADLQRAKQAGGGAAEVFT